MKNSKFKKVIISIYYLNYFLVFLNVVKLFDPIFDIFRNKKKQKNKTKNFLIYYFQITPCNFLKFLDYGSIFQITFKIIGIFSSVRYILRNFMKKK